MRQAQQGFTLVELMLVLGIASILASMALPSYQRYKGQARQAEGKGMLSKIFIVEQAFLAEHKTYIGDLPTAGFLVDNYTLNAVQGDFEPNANVRAYYGYNVGPDSVPPNYSSLGITSWTSSNGAAYSSGMGYAGGADQCAAVSFFPVADGGMGKAIATTQSDTFEARVIGCPLRNEVAGSTNLDRWSMNQNREIKQLNQQE